jgi:hypothetical protein
VEFSVSTHRKESHKPTHTPIHAKKERGSYSSLHYPLTTKNTMWADRHTQLNWSAEREREGEGEGALDVRGDEDGKDDLRSSVEIKKQLEVLRGTRTAIRHHE